MHMRIRSLAPLRLSRFGRHLQRLFLRQNLISSLDATDFVALDELEELDLYDNRIRTVGEALDTLRSLKYVSIHSMSMGVYGGMRWR